MKTPVIFAVIAGTGLLYFSSRASAANIPSVDFAAFPNDGEVYNDLLTNAIPAQDAGTTVDNSGYYDPSAYNDGYGDPYALDQTDYGTAYVPPPVSDGYFVSVNYNPTAGLQSMGNAMRVSIQGITALENFEGFKSTPYKDVAGFWTIGYGHKLRSGEWYSQITPEQAQELLVNDVGIAEDAVNDLVTVPLSQPQFDALVSLAYNIGVNNFKNSTLLRLLNQGDYQGALAQFALWRKAGGVVVQGLVNRRTQEAQMFASGTQGTVA